ncbi:MAG TPA: NTP transferase domain-containing protein [Anaerolineae bacterium]|nr:NTP transferase domain-containing protein [Anaerolineae bacterium]
MKIVIPTAGYGKRLRPHTWSRPKPLLTVADKPVLGHVLDLVSTLPSIDEVVFIIGHLGDQIERYVAERHPQLPARFVEQTELLGQSHAIWLARQGLEGPMVMTFVDTLIETDLTGLADEQAEAVAWVRQVPDPRRFGVARVGEGGWVTRLIEKPKDMHENLAVVGFYYFQESRDLISAIDEQMKRSIQLKGEFFLADAINLMLDASLKLRVQQVDSWHDCGTPEALLETNCYLLENGRDNSDQAAQWEGVSIQPPVFISPSASLQRSVIGPHVSIGPNCVIDNAVIRNSIIEQGTRIQDCTLVDSLLGRDVHVSGGSHSLNVGDHSQIRSE